jgi:MoaA/NifB/PqqE/SkfB family radical SAM enzyme
MMFSQPLIQTIRRYRSLKSESISALPIVILMPHSACNCKCVMCDIWKGNRNLKQLNETDISSLMAALKKFGTKQVVMSGGEALLNPLFFRFCEILQEADIQVTLLSTGLTLQKNAANLVRWVHDIIVSLDGDEQVHDHIRGIPGAFQKLKEGVRAIREIRPGYRVAARTVIHRLNFRHWANIIEAAKKIGVDHISFLPADVSSEAFNRSIAWDKPRQNEILLDESELAELSLVIAGLEKNCQQDFQSHYIAETPEKIWKIHKYYAAFHGNNPFPYKKCNAPWVSTVIDANGEVRPCFFHPVVGNIREHSLDKIINGPEAIRFRRNLDMRRDSICVKCVCYLNLSPGTNPLKQD